jgi:glucokinase
MANAVLGVDIGGTKVAAGPVNEAGEILHKVRVEMVADRTSADAMACVHRAIRSAMDEPSEPIRAIGISSPGPLDPRRGVILKTPNLPCWKDFPLLDAVEQEYGLPTRVENDANAAGLAEAIWGSGVNYRSLFYATIGTGIGTAIIHDRRIFHGRTGAAAEGGHMTIDVNAPVRCGCGKRGCVESMVSGPAIAARAAEALALNSPASISLQAVASDGVVSTQAIFDAFDSGEPFATRIVSEASELLSVWLGNIVDLLEPDAIIIGGGLGVRLATSLSRIASGILNWTINPRANEIPVLPAFYGAYSGLAGAAALWHGRKESAVNENRASIE